MKRFAVCAVLSVTSFASFAQAQEMPAAYKQLLDTGGNRRFQKTTSSR